MNAVGRARSMYAREGMQAVGQAGKQAGRQTDGCQCFFSAFLRLWAAVRATDRPIVCRPSRIREPIRKEEMMARAAAEKDSCRCDSMATSAASAAA